MVCKLWKLIRFCAVKLFGIYLRSFSSKIKVTQTVTNIDLYIEDLIQQFQQFNIMAKNQEVYEYKANPLNTVEQRRFAFQSDIVRSQLISRNIDIEYFMEGAGGSNSPALPYVLTIYGMGRCYNRNIAAATYAGLEMIAPNLPDGNFANQANARAIFVDSIIAYLVRHGFQSAYARTTGNESDRQLADAAEASHALTAAEANLLRAGIAAHAEQDPAAARIAYAGVAAVENINYQTLANLLCKFLTWLYNNRKTNIGESIGANLYTLAYMALGKRGTVSAAKLQSIKNDIMNECRHTIDLSTEEINAYYSNMLGVITQDNAQEIMQRLSQDRVTFSLRLRLTVEQGVKGGMTSYWSIIESFIRHPRFPWAEARRYIGQDFERFDTACGLVRGNPYYGFRTNLGEAAATRYKSLTWLAMHLLVAKNGAEYRSLRQYATFNRVPDAHLQLQVMIDNYNPEIPAADEQGTDLIARFRNLNIEP